MFLYEKDKEKVNIYSAKQNLEKMAEYKKQEMEQIDKDKRIIRILSKGDLILQESENPIIEFSRLSQSHGIFFDSKPFFFTRDNNKDLSEINDKILQYYYGAKVNEGEYESSFNHGVKKIIDYDIKSNEWKTIYNFLLTFRNYHPYGSNTRGSLYTHSMDDIISLPNSLYLLQLLIKKEFKLLINENISEQLNLFNIEKYGVISIEDLEKANNFDPDKLPPEPKIEYGWRQPISLDDIAEQVKVDVEVLRILDEAELFYVETFEEKMERIETSSKILSKKI